MGYNWNISRMECKVIYFHNMKFDLTIGIYPEWNVKPNRKLQGRFCLMIGIYPEWNVKLKLKKDCLISL